MVLIRIGGGLGGKLTESKGREVVGGRLLERKTEDTTRGGVRRGCHWRETVRRDEIGYCRRNISRRRKILIRRGHRSVKVSRTGNCLPDGTWQGGRRKVFCCRKQSPP